MALAWNYSRANKNRETVMITMPCLFAFWTEFGHAADMLGVAGFVVSLGVLFFSSEVWRAYRRKTAPITLALCTRDTRECLELPYRPRRDTLSRGELLGILGMYHGGPRFDAAQVDLYPIFSGGRFEEVVAGKRTRARHNDRLELTCDRIFFDACKRNLAQGGPTPEAPAQTPAAPSSAGPPKSTNSPEAATEATSASAIESGASRS